MLTKENVIDYIITPVLKPIQIDRKIVKVRKTLNRIMRKPIRFQNVTLSTRIVETEHFVYSTDNETPSEKKLLITLKTSKLEGRISTRIEKYANKQVVLVFTNVDDIFLRPINKTIHN